MYQINSVAKCNLQMQGVRRSSGTGLGYYRLRNARPPVPRIRGGYSGRGLRGLGDNCVIDATTGQRVCGDTATAALTATGQLGAACQPRYTGAIFSPPQSQPRYMPAQFTAGMSVCDSGTAVNNSSWSFVGYQGAQDVYQRVSGGDGTQLYALVSGPGQYKCYHGTAPASTAPTFMFQGQDSAADVYISSDGSMWGTMTNGTWMQGTGAYPRASSVVTTNCATVASTTGIATTATALTTGADGTVQTEYITDGGSSTTAWPTSTYSAPTPAPTMIAPSGGGLTGWWNGLASWEKIGVGAGAGLLAYKFLLKGRR
jgi:hypothetical protein